MTNGLIIAAPSSGAGKTMITLGLIRALKNRGIDVSSAKSGPDYIDPAFHHAASGKACINLDAWAMKPAQLRGLAHHQGGELLLVEGAMGLFDGALDANDPYGRGSVADLAAVLTLPVVLVLDASKQGQTAAAIVAGMAGFRDDVQVVGVILNKVASPRHHDMLALAIETQGIPVIGSIPRSKKLARPSRHLGLVQAQEQAELQSFIHAASEVIDTHVDLDRLISLAKIVDAAEMPTGFPPLGQHIAVARDAAFAFAYPHLLQGWRDAGAQISFFSPLDNQGPDPLADAVFLPGGYPELYAGKIASNTAFLTAMRQSNAMIYGECGGYMVLGERLIDGDGYSHNMLGLLPVSTSFANPKIHLGYRNLTGLAGVFKSQTLKAHEFHYASLIEGSATGHLFAATDSMGHDLGLIGHIKGRVSGSFAHIIC